MKSNTSRFILNYFWGNIIISVASLVSFPVFVRVLSVSDYGIMALVSSTLTVVFVFSKMGIQNSIIRFYHDFESGGNEKRSAFFSTYAVSMTLIGIVTLAIFLIVVPLLTKRVFSIGDSLPFFVAGLLIPAHGAVSLLGNFLKAKQEAVQFNILSILDTYAPLVTGLAFMYLLGATVANFFLGAFVGKLPGILHYGRKLRSDYKFSFRSVSSDLLEKAFWYGSPLMLFELAGNLLASGDRFIIKYYLSEKDVAIYAVGYNLATYMVNVFVTPVNTAVQVEYMGVWSRQGKVATEEYLSKVFRAIFFFGTIFCVLAVLNFKYVILLFATSKYLDSIRIAPLVIPSVFLYSLYPIFGAGIYVAKTTRLLLYCIVGALIINFAANIYLIPRMGIMGAAVATFGSYAVACLAIYQIARRVVRIPVGLKNILLCLFAGVVSYQACQLFEFESIFLNILGKSIASLGIYCALVMLFDRKFMGYILDVYQLVRDSLNRRTADRPVDSGISEGE